MDSIHDPQKHVSYLQQCLSSDKMPIGFLLGAGCPVSIVSDDKSKTPLIPDIAGITKSIMTALKKNKDCAPSLTVLESHFKTDGKLNQNVEDILSHIRALRAVAGKGKVRDLSADNLDKLDETICDLINDLADKNLPDMKTPYHRVALWIDNIGREKPVEIFTTNYDLLMEQALEDCRVPYFDGFAGTRKPFFDLRAMEEDMLPPRWARAWKLHGSLNWYQIEKKGVFRSGTKEPSGTKRVIHPSHLKYDESRRMPYLAMFDRLRAFLKQPTSVLIICGYSFRDQHVNEVLLQGLQSTPTSIAFALLHGKIEGYPQAISIAGGRSNLNLLAKDGAVISGREGKWIEKDNGAIPDATRWIRWSPVDTKKPDGQHRAEFQLGDFAVFGEFLHELVGEEHHSSGVLNAK
ncbi:MAG: SIR2 family protein [Thaumarchaeota archaeon]|nr:SIR2 family protein [Nitrososphaerota archaeon]MCL5033573.1 SIR2 family protein [Bacteroidota bacterium]